MHIDSQDKGLPLTDQEEVSPLAFSSPSQRRKPAMWFSTPLATNLLVSEDIDHHQHILAKFANILKIWRFWLISANMEILANLCILFLKNRDSGNFFFEYRDFWTHHGKEEKRGNSSASDDGHPHHVDFLLKIYP